MSEKPSEVFVGPRPYAEENARVFFGREREARDLVSLIVANSLLLVYAPSGAGKTSLINARLIPMLGTVKDPALIPLIGTGKGFDIFPTARVSGVVPQGLNIDSVPGANIFVFNALMSLRTIEATHARSDITLGTSLARKRLADCLDEIRSASEEVVPSELESEKLRILIFDQFEEIFTSHLERWPDREGFFEQVAEALKGGPVFLRPRDIKRARDLAEKILRGQDSVSKLLRALIAQSRLQAISAVTDWSQPTEVTMFVEELNVLIRGESLFSSEAFANVLLRTSTQRMIAVERKSKNFTDLNRALLEDAYPDEIFPRVAGDPALRVVLSMREDYIAELDPYLHLLPGRLSTSCRLERLRREAALEAVTGPMQFTHLRFAPGVADQLVDNLLKTPVMIAHESTTQTTVDKP